jgi:hypothetical protein
VQQCTTCEGLYCNYCAEDTKKEDDGAAAEKADGIFVKTKCLNKECKSQDKLKTSPIGKILKSMI